MSFKKDLGKLVSVLIIGLPACAGQQVVKDEIKAQAVPVQEETQTVPVSSEPLGAQLVYDSEIEFTDSFPIPNGTHRVKAWKDNERKLSIVEISYEDGVVERYWDSNEDRLWDAVEEVNGRIISFYSRVPESLVKAAQDYRLGVTRSAEEKQQETDYWNQRLDQWQNSVAEFDGKYDQLKQKIGNPIN